MFASIENHPLFLAEQASLLKNLATLFLSLEVRKNRTALFGSRSNFLPQDFGKGTQFNLPLETEVSAAKLTQDAYLTQLLENFTTVIAKSLHQKRHALLKTPGLEIPESVKNFFSDEAIEFLTAVYVRYVIVKFLQLETESRDWRRTYKEVAGSSVMSFEARQEIGNLERFANLHSFAHDLYLLKKMAQRLAKLAAENGDGNPNNDRQDEQVR